MDDRVSGEAKLAAAKEIVATYIKSAVIQDGEHSRRLDISPDQICDLFKQVYNTIDETLPAQQRKVGLGM